MSSSQLAIYLKQLEQRAQAQLKSRDSTGIHYYNYWELKALIETLLDEKEKPLDLDQLRSAIRTMNTNGNNTDLYKLLKEELTERGWWKNRARHNGDPNHFAKLNNNVYIANGQDMLTKTDLTNE